MLRKKFRVTTYLNTYTRTTIVELKDRIYGEWIIYDSNIPKFHINLLRNNSNSDIRLRELIENNGLTIRQIISSINLKQKRHLSFGEKPKFYLLSTNDSVPIRLKPIPLYFLSHLKTDNFDRFPNLHSNQVALIFASLESGHILTLDFETYRGVGEIYHIFKNIEEACGFAKIKIDENQDFECCIFSAKDKAVKYLNLEIEKDLPDETKEDEKIR